MFQDYEQYKTKKCDDANYITVISFNIVASNLYINSVYCHAMSMHLIISLLYFLGKGNTENVLVVKQIWIQFSTNWPGL